MSQCFGTEGAFVDRRNYDAGSRCPWRTRTAPIQQQPRRSVARKLATLAVAIDEYKVRHRRRFITYEEMLAVVKSLGYSK